MDKKKSHLSPLYDIVCTFCVVAVVASVLSFTLPEHEQTVASNQSLKDSTAITVANSTVNTQANRMANLTTVALTHDRTNRLSDCKIIGTTTEALYIVDCAEQQQLTTVGSRI